MLDSEIGGIKVCPAVLEGSCKALDGDSTSAAVGPPNVKSPELTRDPYTCERLTQIRGGYTRLTTTHPVLRFDFTNPEVWTVVTKMDLPAAILFSSSLQIPLPESHVSLTAVAQGQVDAVAVWFDLYLDSENSFSTGPSWDISWEQAIFPLRQDLHLQAGDTLHLHASCTDTQLQMDVDGVSRGEGAHEVMESCSTDGEQCRPSFKANSKKQHLGKIAESAEPMKSNGDEEGTPAAGKEDDDRLFYVERSDLSRLNDSEYIDCYQRALAEAVAAVKSGDLEESESSEGESNSSEMEEEEIANCLLLDLTSGLSPFGLLAAKEGK